MWNIKKKNLRITISGLSGCGNTSVSTKLSKDLGIEFINYTFRSLAKEKGMKFEELRVIAEKDDSWDLMVDRRQVELSLEKSCVVGSRLAIWMIPNSDLKIFLDASEEVRAERIYKREGGDLESVRIYTHDRDLADHARYLTLYNIDVSKYHQCADLVIDANIKTVDEIVLRILEELEKNLLIEKQ